MLLTRETLYSRGEIADVRVGRPTRGKAWGSLPKGEPWPELRPLAWLVPGVPTVVVAITYEVHVDRAGLAEVEKRASQNRRRFATLGPVSAQAGQRATVDLAECHDLARRAANNTDHRCTSGPVVVRASVPRLEPWVPLCKGCGTALEDHVPEEVSHDPSGRSWSHTVRWCPTASAEARAAALAAQDMAPVRQSAVVQRYTAISAEGVATVALHVDDSLSLVGRWFQPGGVA